MKNKNKKRLEFFIADEINLSSFRIDMNSMEHPFFSLKAGVRKTRKYKNGNKIIMVEPTRSGIATIFDKDIWIYSISKLQEAINNNKPISRIVRFTSYDFLNSTNREIGGRTYNELKNTLRRLSGTRITTNIFYSKEKQKTLGFGLIDSWYIINKKKGNLNISVIELTLPIWLYEALCKKKILKINPDYFKIRKAIDRRIYEIARKHCGNQKKFSISIKKLYLKSGSMSSISEFKRMIKKLNSIDNLPDYKIELDIKNDIITFKNKKLLKKINKKNKK